MSTPAEKLRIESMKTAIQVALDAADGNRDQAAATLLGILAENTELYEQVMAPLVSKACRDLIAEEALRRRAVYWNAPPAVSAVDHPGRIMSLANANARSLLEYRLSTGLRLRHASLEDIRAEGDMHAKFAEANAVRARWFGLIAERMGKTKAATVGDALDDAALAALQVEAGA